ncbi:MAG: holo-ACP synthase [Rickettsiales bacterium]
MIYNIGTDIVSVKRIDSIYKKHGDVFIKKILSVKEQEIFSKRQHGSNYLAKRFAAKEALAKSFGTGIGKISFKDISVLNYNTGMPYLELSSNLKNIAESILGTASYKLHISISDDKDLALAFATIEIRNDTQPRK